MHFVSGKRITAAKCQLPGRFAWTSWQWRWTCDWKVSSCGRVQNSFGRISYGTLLDSGYRSVHIEKRNYLVHRLVAAAFLGPAPDPSCWQVNHVDCDPANNQVRNLQYVTHGQNQKHSWAANPSRRSKISNAAMLSKAVLWRPCGEESWTFCASQSEAARLLGVPQGAVSSCCRGLQLKSRGGGVWYEFKPAAADSSADHSLLLGEVWQPARYPGRRGRIENLVVSNHGRVAQEMQGSCNPADMHRGTRMRSGYYIVTRAGRSLFVHRLVAATFLGQSPSADHQVNHKDSNRGNNHIQIWSMSRRLRTCGTRMRSVWDRIRSQEPPSRCWPVSGEATDPGWSLSRSRQRLPTQGSIGPSSPASATGLTPPFLGSSGSRPRCCCRAKSGARWCCRA